MIIKWKDVGYIHHEKEAIVWADSTHRSPLLGEGPYEGVIVCEHIHSIPILKINDHYFHSFAGWWDVKIK